MQGPLSGPPPALPRVLGDYELLGLLGRGGMAEVYRARVRHGPREGHCVALKRLLPGHARDPGAVALFEREARLTQALDHPSIVKLLDVGSADGELFLVMELVDGRDLGRIVRRCRERGIPLPLDFALYLARVLLEALDVAHTARGPGGQPLGIVHCDVSPSNLFISRLGEVKLGDFGVARMHSGEGRAAADVLGKPYYLSPEALEGHLEPAADLWAATVVLYELLTLQRPFAGRSPEEVYAAIRARHYRPLQALRPEVPAPLEAVVARGFAARPGERFACAASYARALTPHLDERVGTPLAIAAVVRGLFGAAEGG